MTANTPYTPKAIPESHRDLVERPLIVSLAVTLPDGTPQVSPVWFNYANGYVYVNSARGRLKDRAMRERPYAALAFVDPDNPYRYLAVRGPIVEITEQGAREHIDFLARCYTGAEKHSSPADQVRVRYKIAPEHVFTRG